MHAFREGCSAVLTTHWTHALTQASFQSLPSVNGIISSEMKTVIMNSHSSCSKPFSFSQKGENHEELFNSSSHYHQYNDSKKRSKCRSFQSLFLESYNNFMWVKEQNWSHYSLIIMQLYPKLACYQCHLDTDDVDWWHFLIRIIHYY